MNRSQRLTMLRHTNQFKLSKAQGAAPLAVAKESENKTEVV